MKRIIFILIFPFLTSCSSIPKENSCKLLSFPTKEDIEIKLNRDGIEIKKSKKLYKWKDEFLGIKKVLQVDIDDDNKQEYIIFAMLKDEEGFADGYIFVCKKKGNELKIKDKIRMYCYFIDAELVEITQDNLPDLIVYGHGGMHCEYLQIYTYREGKLTCLFDKGSPAGIEFKFDENYNPQIWIGRENWQDPKWCYATSKRLWEVHVWNGKSFEYSKELSTSPLLSQEEATGQYIEKVRETYEELSGK